MFLLDGWVFESASAGFPRACSKYAKFMQLRGKNLEALVWAEKAAEADDSLGLFLASQLVPRNDEDRIADLMRRAAEAGHAEACFRYSHSFGQDSPDFWRWRGKALARGHTEQWRAFFDALTRFYALFGQCPHVAGPALFEFGCVLLGQISENGMEKRVFGERRSHAVVECAKNVCEMFLHWIELAKRSLMTWLLVATCLGVAKDIRVLIAKLAWKDRIGFCHQLSKNGCCGLRLLHT
jgi:hypothetical protein